MCYYWTGRYEEAISVVRKFHKLAGSHIHDEAIWAYHLMLAMNYIKLGPDQEARDALAELLQLFPDFSLEWNRIYSAYRDPKYLEAQQEDLKKAGLK